MRELFIYYQASAAHAAALEAAAHAMQRRLCTVHPGLQARLLRRQVVRPPGSDGAQAPWTWMETYAHQAGIDDTLLADIERVAEALTPWLCGPRHTEAFAPCA